MATKGTYTYEYPHPAVGVDCLIFTLRDEQLEILLIQRKQEPFKGRWAFPGGFIEEKEPPEAAARRELMEETAIKVGDLWPLGVFGDPDRDPRGWVLSTPFYGLVQADRVQPKGGDDAANAQWRPANRPGPMGFDHPKILKAGLARLRRDIYVMPVVGPLLPKQFSLQELHQVYRVIDPNVPTPALLRRRLEDAGIIKRDKDGAGLRFDKPRATLSRRRS